MNLLPLAAAMAPGQRSTRIAFASDPSGVRGLTGAYHLACSKPFDSLARAINMLGRFRG